MITLLFIYHGLLGQDCTAEFNPDVFLETFGGGSNLGPELPVGATTYNFGSIGGGNYIVTNNSGVNGALWHDAPDHTPGDTDGYMLLFDAASDPGIFFQTVVEDLCPNTNYIFSCYAANIVVPTACGGNSVTPNLRFSIIDPTDGMETASVNTGDIPTTPEMNWAQYSINFNTSANQTSLLLRVSNNSPGGCGNDLVLDDFNLRICDSYLEQQFDICDLPGGSISVGSNVYSMPGTYTDQIAILNSCNDSTVVTTLSGQATLLEDVELSFCFGDTVILDNGMEITNSINFTDTIGNVAGCPQFQSYFITAQMPQLVEQSITLCNGDSIQVGTNTYQEAGVYEDQLTTTIGCDSTVITTISLGSISATLDQDYFEIPQGESINLLANASSSSGFLSYQWQPAAFFSCTDCPNPSFYSLEAATYSLLVSDTTTSCSITVNFSFDFLPCGLVYIPNAFSPNNDGVNDHFAIYGERCLANIKAIQIFDRWGGLVYEGENLEVNAPLVEWTNRETFPAGVYVYDVILETLLGEEIRKSGDVLLLR